MTATRQAPVSAGFRFPRADRRTLLLGMRAPQLAILGATVLISLGLLMAVPSALGLLGALATMALGTPVAIFPVRGATLDQWAPVILRWGVVRLTKRQAWSSAAPVLGGQGRGPERADPPPPLAGVTLLRVKHATGDTAVVHDARAGTFTGVIACRGQAFTLLDDAEQERLTALWGQVLASFAQEGSAVSRLAWVERTVAEEGDALDAYLGEAAFLDADHPAFASYAELVADAGPVSQHHQGYVALSISTSRARRAINAAGGGDRGACEVLLRELTTLADRLRHAEVEVLGALATRELAGVLRCAFDPASAKALARRARHDPDHAGTAGANAWPMGTEVAFDHYRSDSGYHATYWMGELPRREVGAAFLHPLLLRASGTHAVAVVMEPIPASKAAKAVESAHANHMADEDLRQRAGYLPSARRTKEHEALLDRERELSEGHADYRFKGYVTVTARDLKGLVLACGEIEQLGFDAQVELRRLYGVQDLAFTYTLPLARGLR